MAVTQPLVVFNEVCGMFHFTCLPGYDIQLVDSLPVGPSLYLPDAVPEEITGDAHCTIKTHSEALMLHTATVVNWSRSVGQWEFQSQAHLQLVLHSSCIAHNARWP